MYYLRAAQDVITENLPAEMVTEGMTYQVGMHLLPLYKVLCRLKMEEILIRSQDVVLENARGVRYINPVYKEIRETIKLIQAMWRDIGLKKALTPTVPDDPFAGRDTLGNYYDSMEKVARKEELIRKK